MTKTRFGPGSFAVSCGAVLWMLAPAAHADVTVENAWVRATVPAQSATGAFLTLTSTEDAKLVAARTPAAKMAELHLSSTHGTTMHMEAVDSVALPAGRAVKLQPGGHHLMLMGVGKPLAAGQKVPITLTIQGRDGKRRDVEVSAEVRPIGSR